MQRFTKQTYLAFALVILLLASACSGGNGGESAAKPGDAQGEGEQATNLTMAFIGIGTFTDIEEVQQAINKITLEKINATVKLVPIDVSAWQQQVNLLLTGSEPLDLLVTSSLFNYSTQVSRGQLIELDELLEQHGQGVVEATDPITFNGTKINGKVYGVSSFREMVADYGFIARKDLLDKHGIDLSQVKSYEDLESVFSVIKEKEPGISPIVQRSTTNAVATELLASQFDSLGDGLGVLKMAGESTEVVNLYETEEYRQAVEQARAWYQAGYIMPDASTTQESNTSLMKANKGFGYFSNMKPGFEEQENSLMGYEMEAVRLTEPVGGSTGPSAFMLSIARNSKTPEKAMQLMNLLYTDADVMNLLVHGLEGKHYVMGDNGQIKPPEGGASGYSFNQWEVGNNSLTYTWEGTNPDQWERIKEFNRSGIYSPALGFSFDASPVKTEIAAVTNVVNQYKAGLESGSLDPDTITEFVDKQKKAGIERIIAEKQKQLDAFLAANK